MKLVGATGKTAAQVARELSIDHTTLGNWVEADNAQQVEREISKEAAVLFVTESTS